MGSKYENPSKFSLVLRKQLNQALRIFRSMINQKISSHRKIKPEFKMIQNTIDLVEIFNHLKYPILAFLSHSF